jgi:hypothetical protein
MNQHLDSLRAALARGEHGTAPTQIYGLHLKKVDETPHEGELRLVYTGNPVDVPHLFLITEVQNGVRRGLLVSDQVWLAGQEDLVISPKFSLPVRVRGSRSICPADDLCVYNHPEQRHYDRIKTQESPTLAVHFWFSTPLPMQFVTHRAGFVSGDTMVAIRYLEENTTIRSIGRQPRTSRSWLGHCEKTGFRLNAIQDSQSPEARLRIFYTGPTSEPLHARKRGHQLLAQSADYVIHAGLAEYEAR